MLQPTGKRAGIIPRCHSWPGALALHRRALTTTQEGHARSDRARCIRPSRPAANDGRAHGEPTDMRMSTRLERVDDREEADLLGVLRERARPPGPASNGRILTSEHEHRVSHWGLKAPSQSSKGLCGQHMQCSYAATGRIGHVACISSRQRTRHTKTQSILEKGSAYSLRGCRRAARRRQRTRMWPRRRGGLAFLRHLANFRHPTRLL